MHYCILYHPGNIGVSQPAVTMTGIHVGLHTSAFLCIGDEILPLFTIETLDHLSWQRIMETEGNGLNQIRRIQMHKVVTRVPAFWFLFLLIV